MQKEFRIVGLAKDKKIICETDNEETFYPTTKNLTQDRFDALWKLLEGHWHNEPTALIEYEYLTESGKPIKPKFIEVVNI